MECNKTPRMHNKAEIQWQKSILGSRKCFSKSIERCLYYYKPREEVLSKEVDCRRIPIDNLPRLKRESYFN